MPRKYTIKSYGRLQRPLPRPDPAAGLHDPAQPKSQPKTYYFRDMPEQAIIGRGPECWIFLRNDKRISEHHAQLDVHDNKVYLIDLESMNGTKIDGQRIERPTMIEVGMRVMVGHKVLYAIDMHGRFPITATTQAGFREQSHTVYGTYELAGERIGCSRETVRLADDRRPPR